MFNCIVPADSQVNFNHTNVSFCFPEKEKCVLPPTTLLAEEGEGWNCSDLCEGDVPYSIKVPADGHMYIQFGFSDTVSADRTAPTATFDQLITTKVRVNGVDSSAVLIGTITSAANNTYDGKRNRQNIKLDFAKIKAAHGDCFSLKFEYGSTVYETNAFQIVDDCILPLVLLESTGLTYDCDGLYYGSYESVVGDDITYSNRIYLHASVKDFGGSVESNYLGTLKTVSSIESRIRVIGKETIPPYMVKYLMSTIIAGQKIYINGEEWDSTSAEFQPHSKNNMTHPVIEFVRSCDKTYGCE